jgi:hypothetical protein
VRALILLESAVVLGLSLGILLRGPTAPGEGDVFRADRLLLDAKPGEKAEYRGDDGIVLAYEVESTTQGGTAQGGPVLHLRTRQRDASGPLPGTDVAYRHLPARHGLFPLLTPTHPEADDRLWIWRRIRRETIPFAGKPLRAWRMDCIDPALPPDEDAVVVYFHEEAPLFGIVRWSRNGRTYDLVSAWKAP